MKQIFARGDCCSRRTFALNETRFPWEFTFVQDEKSPAAVHVDAIKGIVPDQKLLARFVDMSRAPRIQQKFFQTQFNRRILAQKTIDLLVIDAYAEMMFRLWRHRREGWRFWCPNACIIDKTAFQAEFVSAGQSSFEQSLADTITFVNHVRASLGKNVPVLYLTQPIAYFPKLAPREEFNKLGQALAAQLSNIFVGKELTRDELDPVDLGSSGGPGGTLHYAGETYWKMIEHCLHSGLSEQLAAGPEVLESAGSVLEQGGAAALGKVGPAQGEALPDAQDGQPLKALTITLDHDASNCNAKCRTFAERSADSLEQYCEIEAKTFVRTKDICFDNAIIALDDYPAYELFEHTIKKLTKGDAVRQKNRALRQGFYCEPFSRKLFIPDIYDVNTSKSVRSGGRLRKSYQKSVEELGGAPVAYEEWQWPPCPNHWQVAFGVFQDCAGYTQGDVLTNKKLYGYISMRRCGELVNYSQFIGHGDYLKEGIMKLLHQHVMEWFIARESPYVKGVKAVMYGAWTSGGEGLQLWKKREGFRPGKLKLIIKGG